MRPRRFSVNRRFVSHSHTVYILKDAQIVRPGDCFRPPMRLELAVGVVDVEFDELSPGPGSGLGSRAYSR